MGGHWTGHSSRAIRRRGACVLACVLVAVSVQAAPVVLVQGTTSTPNTSERNYAGSVTRRIDGWLTDLDIPHRVLNDEELSRQTLGAARVVMLTYNPRLPDKELAVLDGFVKRGGRLVVFYSADPNLARLMGVKLGEYRADPTASRWTRMHFIEEALPGAPVSIYQRSRNIRTVKPRRRQGNVVAYWEDLSGKRREPAWVQTATGFWMTHVLLDDGDTWRKQQLLISILGHLDPELWPIAVRAALHHAQTLGTFESYLETERVIRSRAPRTGSAAHVAAALATARKTRVRLEKLARNKEYVAAVSQSSILYRQLMNAYAITFRKNAQRVRGVWDHSALGLYPGDWRRTCRELDSHGITDVFVNALWAGLAFYPSNVLPVADMAAGSDDPLGDAVTAAHAQGLKVHLWKVCWNLYKTPESFVAQLRKAGRLQISDEGDELLWLCPSNPDNLRQEKDALREVLQRYPIDGIHLDYVRYPGSHACYCEGCRKRFESHLGRRVAQWPADAREGTDVEVFTRWRCAQITRLVRDVSTLARRMRPGIRISAAVYGKYPSCANSVAQDWPGWVNDGLIDLIVPMNYTESWDFFVELLDSQTKLIKDVTRLCPGIGVTASNSRLGPPAVLRQIEEVQKRGASGFVLFSLNEILSREILPYLRLE